MQYILRVINAHSDAEFINANSFNIDASGDSGWCDASTGCRILSNGDVVLFSNVSIDQELVLLLRYGDKIVKVV